MFNDLDKYRGSFFYICYSYDVILAKAYDFFLKSPLIYKLKKVEIYIYSSFHKLCIQMGKAYRLGLYNQFFFVWHSHFTAKGTNISSAGGNRQKRANAWNNLWGSARHQASYGFRTHGTQFVCWISALATAAVPFRLTARLRDH